MVPRNVDFSKRVWSRRGALEIPLALLREIGSLPFLSFHLLQRSLLGFPGTKRQSVTRARDELLTASVRQSASSCLGSSLLKLLRGMMEEIFYLSRCAITQESATGSRCLAAEATRDFRSTFPCNSFAKRVPFLRKLASADSAIDAARNIERKPRGSRSRGTLRYYARERIQISPVSRMRLSAR